MTTTTTDISEERLRQFVADGGIPEEDLTGFLDEPCHSMTLQNMDAQVLMDMLNGGKLYGKGVVVGVKDNGNGTMNLLMWVSKLNSMDMLATIKQSYQDREMENPYELLDLEQMDKAISGREMVRAMLTGAAREGQDIS